MKYLTEFDNWANLTLLDSIDLPLDAVLNEAKDPRTPHPEDSIFNGVAAAQEVSRALGYVISNPESITIKWDGKPAILFGNDDAGNFCVMDKYMFDAKFMAKSPRDWLKYDQQKTSGKIRGEELYSKIANVWNGLKYAAQGTTGFFWGDLLWGERLTPENGKFVFQGNTVTYSVSVDSNLGKVINGKVGGVGVHQYFADANTKPVQWNGKGLKTDGPVAILTPTVGVSFKLTNPAKLAASVVSALSNPQGVDEFLNGMSNVARAAIKTYMNKYITRQTTQNLEDWLATNISGSQYKFLTQPSQQVVDGKTVTAPGYLVQHKKELNQVFKIWNSVNNLKNNLVDQLESQVQGLQQHVNGVQGGEGFVFNTPAGLVKLVNRGHFSAANFSKNATKELTEGGNVFKDASKGPLTQRIKKEDVPQTVGWLEKLTGIDLTKDKDQNGYPVKWLGSTGRKADSGDLDLAVSLQEISKDQLAKKLYDWCRMNGVPENQILNKKGYSGGWIERTGISVHFKAPIKGDPSNGFVQTDFMFLENPAWSTWYMSNDPNSNFKGVNRNILINSVAKGSGYKVNQNTGLHNRATGELITDNPEKTAKLILGPGATVADLSSVESILKALESDPNRESKLKDFKEYMAREGVDVDTILGAPKDKLSEDNPSKEMLIIYPGGFHPFHLGHASVFDHLANKFSDSEVFVAATDSKAERPFGFNEKKFLANQSGVPDNRFVQVKSPYQAKEITTNYDPSTTVLVFAVSEKDRDRFNFAPKKDGTPGYFQPYTDGPKDTMDKHGYIYVVPKIDFSIAGEVIDSASKIRNMYGQADDAGRKQIIGDLYPLAKAPNKIKRILDNVLGGITEADNPNYFGGSSMSAIPGTPESLMPRPDPKDIQQYRKEMAELKKFMGH
jgi:hypothetical protein